MTQVISNRLLLISVFKCRSSSLIIYIYFFIVPSTPGGTIDTINDPNKYNPSTETECSRCAELERELIKERERLKKALAILDRKAREELV